MSDLISLAVALSSAVVPTAIGLATSLYDRARRRRHEAALVQLGRRLGFSLARGGLEGTVDGVFLWMSIERVAADTGAQGRLTIQTRIDPPMDLGLLVRRQEAMPRQVGTVFAARDQILGDKAFDDRFYVCGDDPARLATLLDVDLRRAILDLARHAHVEVADGWIRLDAYAVQPEPRLHALLQQAARLTRLVDVARGRVAPAFPVSAHVDAWRRAAHRLGFRTGSTPLLVAGALDGTPVAAFTHRIDPVRFATRVRADFRRPLGFDLIARSRRGFAFGPLPATGTVRVGDEAVDRLLSVQTERVDLAARVLGSSEVFAALARLQELGTIWIDDRGVTLALPDLGGAEALGGHLERVRALAELVQAAAGEKQASAGFYR